MGAWVVRDAPNLGRLVSPEQTDQLGQGDRCQLEVEGPSPLTVPENSRET